MKTKFKVELKIKGVDELKTFENVKEIFIENNFLIIATDLGKNKDKLDPIDLFAIDYWKELGERKREGGNRIKK